MAFALPNREHLGPSLICRATNSVAVVPSQRCRTSAGLTLTFMRAGKVRTGIGGAFVSILDSRALTGGYNLADVLLLQQLSCDRLEPPASIVDNHTTTLYKNTCKRPPPEGFFSDFQRRPDTVRVPCLRHQPGYIERPPLTICPRLRVFKSRDHGKQQTAFLVVSIRKY